jgi:hypothetical protein
MNCSAMPGASHTALRGTETRLSLARCATTGQPYPARGRRHTTRDGASCARSSRQYSRSFWTWCTSTARPTHPAQQAAAGTRSARDLASTRYQISLFFLTRRCGMGRRGAWRHVTHTATGPDGVLLASLACEGILLMSDMPRVGSAPSFIGPVAAKQQPACRCNAGCKVNQCNQSATHAGLG